MKTVQVHLIIWTTLNVYFELYQTDAEFLGNLQSLSARWRGRKYNSYYESLKERLIVWIIHYIASNLCHSGGVELKLMHIYTFLLQFQPIPH